ncbi:unnamed protein product [Amoebophrya sp. A120]|nr:unnamed protein product [Amoebophrya sp. A120]|eukprot:GSA120T00018461001.1
MTAGGSSFPREQVPEATEDEEPRRLSSSKGQSQLLTAAEVLCSEELSAFEENLQGTVACAAPTSSVVQRLDFSDNEEVSGTLLVTPEADETPISRPDTTPTNYVDAGDTTPVNADLATVRANAKKRRRQARKAREREKKAALLLEQGASARGNVGGEKPPASTPSLHIELPNVEVTLNDVVADENLEDVRQSSDGISAESPDEVAATAFTQELLAEVGRIVSSFLQDDENYKAPSADAAKEQGVQADFADTVSEHEDVLTASVRNLVSTHEAATTEDVTPDEPKEGEIAEVTSSTTGSSTTQQAQESVPVCDRLQQWEDRIRRSQNSVASSSSSPDVARVEISKNITISRGNGRSETSFRDGRKKKIPGPRSSGKAQIPPHLVRPVGGAGAPSAEVTSATMWNTPAMCSSTFHSPQTGESAVPAIDDAICQGGPAGHAEQEEPSEHAVVGASQKNIMTTNATGTGATDSAGAPQVVDEASHLMNGSTTFALSADSTPRQLAQKQAQMLDQSMPSPFEHRSASSSETVVQTSSSSSGSSSRSSMSRFPAPAGDDEAITTFVVAASPTPAGTSTSREPSTLVVNSSIVIGREEEADTVLVGSSRDHDIIGDAVVVQSRSTTPPKAERKILETVEISEHYVETSLVHLSAPEKQKVELAAPGEDGVSQCSEQLSELGPPPLPNEAEIQHVVEEDPEPCVEETMLEMRQMLSATSLSVSELVQVADAEQDIAAANEPSTSTTGAEMEATAFLPRATSVDEKNNEDSGLGEFAEDEIPRAHPPDMTLPSNADERSSTTRIAVVSGELQLRRGYDPLPRSRAASRTGTNLTALPLAASRSSTVVAGEGNNVNQQKHAPTVDRELVRRVTRAETLASTVLEDFERMRSSGLLPSSTSRSSQLSRHSQHNSTADLLSATQRSIKKMATGGGSGESFTTSTGAHDQNVHDPEHVSSGVDGTNSGSSTGASSKNSSSSSTNTIIPSYAFRAPSRSQGIGQNQQHHMQSGASLSRSTVAASNSFNVRVRETATSRARRLYNQVGGRIKSPLSNSSASTCTTRSGGIAAAGGARAAAGKMQKGSTVRSVATPGGGVLSSTTNKSGAAPMERRGVDKRRLEKLAQPRAKVAQSGTEAENRVVPRTGRYAPGGGFCSVEKQRGGAKSGTPAMANSFLNKRSCANKIMGSSTYNGSSASSGSVSSTSNMPYGQQQNFGSFSSGTDGRFLDSEELRKDTDDPSSVAPSFEYDTTPSCAFSGRHDTKYNFRGPIPASTLLRTSCQSFLRESTDMNFTQEQLSARAHLAYSQGAPQGGYSSAKVQEKSLSPLENKRKQYATRLRSPLGSVTAAPPPGIASHLGFGGKKTSAAQMQLAQYPGRASQLSPGGDTVDTASPLDTYSYTEQSNSVSAGEGSYQHPYASAEAPLLSGSNGSQPGLTFDRQVKLVPPPPLSSSATPMLVGPFGAATSPTVSSPPPQPLKVGFPMLPGSAERSIDSSPFSFGGNPGCSPGVEIVRTSPTRNSWELVPPEAAPLAGDAPGPLPFIGSRYPSTSSGMRQKSIPIATTPQFTAPSQITAPESTYEIGADQSRKGKRTSHSVEKLALVNYCAAPTGTGTRTPNHLACPPAVTQVPSFSRSSSKSSAALASAQHMVQNLSPTFGAAAPQDLALHATRSGSPDPSGHIPSWSDLGSGAVSPPRPSALPAPIPYYNAPARRATQPNFTFRDGQKSPTIEQTTVEVDVPEPPTNPDFFAPQTTAARPAQDQIVASAAKPTSVTYAACFGGPSTAARGPVVQPLSVTMSSTTSLSGVVRSALSCGYATPVRYAASSASSGFRSRGNSRSYNYFPACSTSTANAGGHSNTIPVSGPPQISGSALQLGQIGGIGLDGTSLGPTGSSSTSTRTYSVAGFCPGPMYLNAWRQQPGPSSSFGFTTAVHDQQPHLLHPATSAHTSHYARQKSADPTGRAAMRSTLPANYTLPTATSLNRVRSPHPRAAEQHSPRTSGDGGNTGTSSRGKSRRGSSGASSLCGQVAGNRGISGSHSARRVSDKTVRPDMRLGTVAVEAQSAGSSRGPSAGRRSAIEIQQRTMVPQEMPYPEEYQTSRWMPPDYIAVPQAPAIGFRC